MNAAMAGATSGRSPEQLWQCGFEVGYQTRGSLDELEILFVVQALHTMACVTGMKVKVVWIGVKVGETDTESEAIGPHDTLAALYASAGDLSDILSRFQEH